jgi:hypothetical protein
VKYDLEVLSLSVDGPITADVVQRCLICPCHASTAIDWYKTGLDTQDWADYHYYVVGTTPNGPQSRVITFLHLLLAYTLKDSSKLVWNEINEGRVLPKAHYTRTKIDTYTRTFPMHNTVSTERVESLTRHLHNNLARTNNKMFFKLAIGKVLFNAFSMSLDRDEGMSIEIEFKILPCHPSTYRENRVSESSFPFIMKKLSKLSKPQ